jgi:hypothetical protein
MLEHGELKINIYHQTTSTNESNQSSDIHLCYCTISLKELISRHTGKLKSIKKNQAVSENPTGLKCETRCNG